MAAPQALKRDPDLLVRILVGAGMSYDDLAEPERSNTGLFYVLNPKLEGGNALTAEQMMQCLEATTSPPANMPPIRPAFVAMSPRTAPALTKKMGCRGDPLQFWLARSIAFAEKDILFTFVFHEKGAEVFHVHVIGFDYSLMQGLGGESLNAFCASIAEEKKIKRSDLKECLRLTFSTLAEALEIGWRYQEGQGLDPRQLGPIFTMGGGKA